MTANWTPYGDQDRTLMWTVLGVWAKSTRVGGAQIERTIRTEFRPLMDTMFAQVVRRQPHPVYLHNTGWLVGEELKGHEGTIPVLTFEAMGSHDQVRDAAFRVAFLSLVDGNLQAEGWRFEQPEPRGHDGKIAAHPYAHAQAIIGWRKDIDCLIHAPHPDGANCDGIHYVEDDSVYGERVRAQKATFVKHPAFPLGVVSLTGLALAVFVSLYGAPRAREVFGEIRGIKTADGQLREDFVRLSVLD